MTVHFTTHPGAEPWGTSDEEQQAVSEGAGGTYAVHIHHRDEVEKVWKDDHPGKEYTFPPYKFRAYQNGDRARIFVDETETPDSTRWLVIHELTHMVLRQEHPEEWRKYQDATPDDYEESDEAHESDPEEQLCNAVAAKWVGADYHRPWWRARVEEKTKEAGLFRPTVRDMTQKDVEKYELKHVDLSKPWDHKIVVRRGKLMGFAAYSPEEKELKQLWVMPDHRRKGVATQLLDAVGPIEQLRVRRTNKSAQKLYERRGLKVKGPAPGNWGDRPASYQMQMAKEAELYHGTSVDVDVLEPRGDHGDPKVPPAVFGAVDRSFALTYAARPWSDRDLNQSAYYKNGKREIVMREMRPGAIEDTYGGAKAYLHTLPGEGFHRTERLGSTWEKINTSPVTPTKTEVIPDALEAMRADPQIQLLEYDPDHPDTRKAVQRMVKRMREMDDGGERYKRWRLKGAPRAIKKMFREEMTKEAGYGGRFRKDEAKVRKNDKKLWESVEGLPVEQVAVDPLYKRYRSKKVWGRGAGKGNKGGGTLSPEGLDAGEGTPYQRYQHKRLLMEADTSYPIIMRPNGRLLDGVHRLVRAKQEGLETIPAVMVKEAGDTMQKLADAKGIKLLYVGAELGGGHKAQAASIAAAAEAKGVPVEMINFFDEFMDQKQLKAYHAAVKEGLAKGTIGANLESLSQHFGLYGSGVDRAKVDRFMRKATAKGEAVVVTLPHLQMAMHKVKEPFYVLHTDPRKWIGETDMRKGGLFPQHGPRIHLGTETAMKELSPRKGVALTGLPVSPNVVKKQPPTGLMDPGKFKVTISGGALGLEVPEMAEKVLKSGKLPKDVEVHAVAGRSKSVLARLKALARKDKRLKPHGFAPLPAMMQEADLNVIRAHGTTFAETQASGKPAVYYGPEFSFKRMLDSQGALTRQTAAHGAKITKNPAAIGLDKIPKAVDKAIEKYPELKAAAVAERKRFGNPAAQAVEAILKGRHRRFRSRIPGGKAGLALGGLALAGGGVAAHPKGREAVRELMAKEAEYAPGLPKKGKVTPLPKTKKPETWAFVAQDHRAKKAGRHLDVRLGNPNTGVAHSWAVPKNKLPSPGGDPVLAVQTDDHTIPYMGFQGRIGKGYGAGEVRTHLRDKIDVVHSEPAKVKFTLSVGGAPQDFAMRRIGEKLWLMQNLTPEKMIEKAARELSARKYRGV